MIDSIASSAGSLALQGQAAVKAARSSAEASPASSMATATQHSAGRGSASDETSQAVTVELSAQAQAKELKTEGMSVAEIATKLNLDAKTVESYLGTEA